MEIDKYDITARNVIDEQDFSYNSTDEENNTCDFQMGYDELLKVAKDLSQGHKAMLVDLHKYQEKSAALENALSGSERDLKLCQDKLEECQSDLHKCQEEFADYRDECGE